MRFLCIICVVVATAAHAQEPVIKDLKDLPAPSAIIRFDLKREVIRVMAEMPNDIFIIVCDLGVSEELLTLPAKPAKAPKGVEPLVIRSDRAQQPAVAAAAPPAQPTGRYAVLVEGLDIGQECKVAFRHGISETGVGFEAKVTKRGKQVICEIRPKYGLPSGDVQPFTKENGVRHYKALQTDIREGQEKGQNRSAIASALAQASSDYYAAQRDSNSGNANLSMSGRTRANNLKKQGGRLESDLRRADAAIARAPIAQRDLAALQQVASYSVSIAPVASLYVRLYAAGMTVKAEVR